MKKCKAKGSYKGQCCCNCDLQVGVYCHPWNKKIGRGSILKMLGYGCMCFMVADRSKDVIFSERKHGSCEMWVEKNKG